MAAGLPVIAARSPAVEEVVGSAGMLCAPGDPAAMAAAIREFETNPDLARDLGASGRERARQFSWDATGKATVEVLSDVLRDSLRRRGK
jgi:glycosyltransferase involved in cell wall biosynthesis